MRFEDIPGLDEVKSKLINAANSGKIAHAQLFMGKPGSPNLPMALAYANYINCTARVEQDACGECPSCLKNQKYIHPDTHFVFPISATKKFTGKDVISTNYLNEWRAFLTEKSFGNLEEWVNYYGGENKQVNISKEESRQIIKSLSLMSFEGEYKILIIWLPEYMHPAAANGILKILEEPSAKTLFLLVSNDNEKLLSTILSRVQFVTIPKFTDQEVKNILTSQHAIDEAKATQLTHLADGDLSMALRLSNDVEDNSHELYANWMRDCFKRDFSSLVNRAEQFHGMNKIAQKSLLQYSLNTLREVLINNSAPELKKLNGQAEEFIKNFSKVMTVEKIEKMSALINDAHYHLERNASPKIIFLDLSLNIARLIK